MRSFDHNIYFESFGVKIAVAANVPEAVDVIRERLERTLPRCYREIAETEVDHRFSLRWNNSGLDSLHLNGKRLLPRLPRNDVLNSLTSKIRLTVAEHAVDHVFIHAGVVALKARAILLPARSFRGKTTLTAELVKRGATYYSDEYAIIDRRGLVHPFLKDISLRLTDDVEQTEHSVGSLGGVSATDPARAALVVLTRFRKNARWRPREMSRARGLLELLKDVVPIRRDPDPVLQILNLLAEDVKFIKTDRGEASIAADEIIKLSEDLEPFGRKRAAAIGGETEHVY